MRVADRIALEILEELESEGIRIPKAKWLECEDMVANIIIKKLKDILKLDTDFKDITDVLR